MSLTQLFLEFFNVIILFCERFLLKFKFKFHQLEYGHDGVNFLITILNLVMAKVLAQFRPIVLFNVIFKFAEGIDEGQNLLKCLLLLRRR